ncbi:MAG: hydroxypyruvate isomerase family protein [Burkholderiales bacterium]|nr:hydroxypyruvate isomerase family protein [Burkholderiales bacterium]
MPKFAANLSMMYQEHAFLDRYDAAARDGFRGVEAMSVYDHPAAEVRERLTRNGLTQVLFNCSHGDLAGGERGIGSLPGREDDFKRSIEQALAYQEVLGNQRMHVMAGILAPGRSREEHRATYVSNLAWAAEQIKGRDLILVIEPINTRDIPGFFLNRQDEAHAICRDTGSDRVKVQMDFYHCQIVEGDLAMKFRQYIAGVGHIQVAGVPERHEPDVGEVNYPYLFRLIDELGYDGWVAGEYRPRGRTSDGLAWMKS